MRTMITCALVGASSALAMSAPAVAGNGCTETCGQNGDKVLLCHVPPGNPENAHTICVSPNAVDAHLANHPGDACGPCDGGPASLGSGDRGGDGGQGCTETCGQNGNKVLLCHVPPGNPENAHTICVSPNAVEAHLANHPGDACGPCTAGAQMAAEGDLDGDGGVGVSDLLQLIDDWGACLETVCESDLNHDSLVDKRDAMRLILNWS